MKMSCWEFKKCGRARGGVRAAELGVCPAASDVKGNGLNSGVNCGRICWAVAGTLCGGKVQGTYAAKLSNCMACDFYQLVAQQEGTGHKSFSALQAVAAPR
jgi:hypothetical protein